MNYLYEELAPGIVRPIIQVRLQSKKIFVLVDAIIDSGADWCIFDEGLLKILKLPMGAKIKFFGAGREPLQGFKSRVTLATAGKKFSTEALFSRDLGRYSYAILGQKGFFDNFKVCFDKKNQKVDIDPN